MAIYIKRETATWQYLKVPKDRSLIITNMKTNKRRMSMTENEIKAIKWIKNVREDAVITLDHIQKNEPNVSPLLYAGRKQKAEAIIKMCEELEQYRAIGTVEEFKALQEKNEPKVAGFDLDDEIYICPNCEKSVGEHQNYCWNCGQKFVCK